MEYYVKSTRVVEVAMCVTLAIRYAQNRYRDFLVMINWT